MIERKNAEGENALPQRDRESAMTGHVEREIAPADPRRATLARLATDLPRSVSVLAIVVFSVAWIWTFRAGGLSAYELTALSPVVIVTALLGVAITWLRAPRIAVGGSRRQRCWC